MVLYLKGLVEKMNETDSKTRIVQSARKLFWKKGYQATKYGEICEAANVNRGTMHFYFKGKRKIAQQIFFGAYRGAEDILHDNMDISEDMFGLCLLYNEMMEKLINKKVLQFLVESESQKNRIEGNRVQQIIENAALAVFNKFLVPYLPDVSKEEVYYLASVWCGMRDYVPEMYYRGGMLETPEKIVEDMLRYLLIFWKLPTDEIEEKIKSVKGYYEKGHLYVGEDFFVHFHSGQPKSLKENVFSMDARNGLLKQVEEWNIYKSTMSAAKEKILQAAYLLFWNKGYEHTSYKDIAQTAGENEGLITYYFQTKSNLAGWIYDDMCMQIDQKIEELYGKDSIWVRGMLKVVAVFQLFGMEGNVGTFLYGFRTDLKFFDYRTMCTMKRILYAEKNTEESVKRNFEELVTFMDGINIELFLGYYVGYLQNILHDGIIEYVFRILTIEYSKEILEEDYVRAKEISKKIKIEVKEPFQVRII